MIVPMSVVKWACSEVHRQVEDPPFVVGMINAWGYAESSINPSIVGVEDLYILGSLVKMVPLREGFRRTQVKIGDNYGAPASELDRLINQLLDNQANLNEDEFCFEFLRIHPFEDGNGRVASILYNTKRRSLKNPLILPEYRF